MEPFPHLLSSFPKPGASRIRLAYSLGLMLSILSIPTTLGAEQRQEGVAPGTFSPATFSPSLPPSPPLGLWLKPLPEDRDLRRQTLLQNIIEATGAEYDWVRHTRRILAEELPQLQDAALQTSLKGLSGQLKDPEKLLFFRPGEGKEDLFIEDIDPQHYTFQSLREMALHLVSFLSQVSPPLQSCFQSLKAYYEGFINRTCAATPQQKKALLAPKASLTGEGLGPYRISQEMARGLISKDLYGFKDKQNTTGMRAVRSHSGVHFKCFDEALDDPRPGQEYMAYALAAALTPYPLVTPSVLLKVENVSLFQPEGEGFPQPLLAAKQAGKSLDEALAQLHLLAQGGWRDHVALKPHHFFIQASQTAGKNNLQQALGANPELVVDPVSLSWQHIFVMLAQPGDGKADNYSVVEQPDGTCQIIGIDNDKLFYPALYKNKSHLYTGINCALYTVTPWMDKPLDGTARQGVLGINPAVMVGRWLGLLEQQNQVYQTLAGQGVLTKADLQTLDLPLRLPPGEGEGILARLGTLQRTLRDFPTSSAHSLLMVLAPEVAGYYGRLRGRYPSDPDGVMATVYKAADEQGALQTVDTVLGLAPGSAAWTAASLKRAPGFTQTPLEATRKLTAQVPLNGLPPSDLAQLIDVLIHNFPGQEDTVLPHLPSGLWHWMVQANAPDGVFSFLLRRDPAGLNRVDAHGKTPLDYAFEHLVHTGEAALAISLIHKGASAATLGGRQYRDLKKKALPPEFWAAFTTLQRHNAKLGWGVTLEEIFPLAAPSQKEGECLQGTSGEKRSLPPAIQQQLGNPLRRMAQGRREVIRLEQGGHTAYVKFYPELVGLEEAIGDLTRRLTGFGAPYGELVRFPDGRPAWVSQGIPGDNLHTVLTRHPQRLAQLDPSCLSQMILMAMLTNPEDGKPDNYIVEPVPSQPGAYRLVCPDNDHAFVPAFTQAKPGLGSPFKKPVLAVQVKSILYCFDIMNQPVPADVRQKFTSHDPLVVMEDWLELLRRHNKRHFGLYPDPRETGKLLKDHQCVIGIPFQKGMVGCLYSKWVRLQDALHADPEITHLELLGRLEPRLANRYRDAFRQKASVLERFMGVDGPFYGQAKGTLATVTPSGSILASQDIPFEQTTLEAMRSGAALGPEQALAELATLAGQKARQGLSLAHMASDIQREAFLREFDFASQPLSGQRHILGQVIQFAAGLRSLTLKNCTPLTKAILQKQLSLGQLVQVDLRGCPEVSRNMLPLLAQANPGLEVLNLAGAPKLKWVADDKPPLKNGYKILFFAQLCQLNLNKCGALQGVDVEAPRLRYLWMDQATALETLKVKVPALQHASFEGSALTDGMLQGLNLGQLRHLNLNGCQALENIEMEALSLISLSANQVANLKTLKLKAPALQQLSFEGSAINDEMLYDLLSHSPSLRVVKLGNCPHISETGQKVFKAFLNDDPTLTELYLDNNQVGNAGVQALTANTTLTMLNLQKNKIGDAGATALGANTTLTWLDLQENKIGDAGAQALAANTTLTRLNLANNQVGDAGAQALAANTTLTRLYLWNNQVGDAGATALGANTTLTSLILYSNQVGDAGATALASNTTLTTLDLSWNQVGDAGATALGANTTLTALNLRQNKIGAEGAQALAANTTLTELYLWNTQVGDAGATALGANTTLTRLDLQKNKIGDAGATALGANTTLIELDLRVNQIGDAGATALGANTTLASLDLRVNQIGDAGGTALGANTTLTRLNLAGNQVGNAGATALAANTTFTTLNLSGNQVGDAGATALSANTTLTTLDLQENEVGDAGKQALRQSPNPYLRNLFL